MARAAGFFGFIHKKQQGLTSNILLAMGIVLWFFWCNLKFYMPGLRWLRGIATLWMLPAWSEVPP